MGVFDVFKIVQIVPNRVKHHKWVKLALKYSDLFLENSQSISTEKKLLFKFFSSNFTIFRKRSIHFQNLALQKILHLKFF